MSVHKYSTTPDNNTTVGDGLEAVGIQEGMPRKNVNNGMRAIAADVAKWRNDLGAITTGGTSSTFTISSADTSVTAYYTGLRLGVKFHADCADDAQIKVGALASVTLKMKTTGGVQNVTAGAIKAGDVHVLVYDGASFQISSATNSGLIEWILESYSDAESAKIPTPATKIAVKSDYGILFYARDALGVALTTADGATWSPLGDAYIEHFGEVTGTDAPLVASAMNWAVSNSRELFARGIYYLGGQGDVSFIGDLMFNFKGAIFIAASGFPGSGTKMFQVTGATGDDLIFDWIGGTYDGQNIPNEGELSTNDMLVASVGDSAKVVRYRLEKTYTGEDWRTAGCDTHLFVNATRVEIHIDHAQGAVDLAVYTTSSSNVNADRHNSHRVTGNFVKCNRAVGIKRDVRNIFVDISTVDCVEGTATQPAEVGGVLAPASAQSGYIRVVALRTQWPVNENRTKSIIYDVTAKDLGVYLPANGVIPEYASTGGSARFKGCKGITGRFAMNGVNPDLVAAKGAGVLDGFRIITWEESVGTNETIQCLDNTVTTVLGLNGVNDIPRQSVELNGSPNRNVIIQGGAFAPSVFIGANSHQFTLRNWNDMGIVHADTVTIGDSTTPGYLQVVANNNNRTVTNPANIIEFFDTDGSSVAGQPMGAIMAYTNDGGTKKLAGYVMPVSGNSNGDIAWQFGTGTVGGSIVTKFSINSSGHIEILENDKGLIFKSPNGSRWLVKVNDSGVVTTTAL